MTDDERPTGRDLVTQAIARFVPAGVESPRHDAEALLAWSAGLARWDAVLLGELDQHVAGRFRATVGRRAAREPLQHITGRAGFRHLDLEVGPGVFVPRPETEIMAGVAVDELHRLIEAGCANPIAVDLCTGSGAVALAMATEAPGCEVTGIEIAAEAHAYAQRNALRYAQRNALQSGGRVDFRLGDIEIAATDLLGRAQVVTANPPYIPLHAFESVAVEARDFDPPVALWSGSDGLDAIRVVAKVAADLLADGGLVLCEHADVQADTASAVFARSPDWWQIRRHRDLAGRPRFVTARRVCRSSPSAGTIGS